MNSPLETLPQQQLLDLLEKKEKAIRTAEKAADRRLRKVEEKMGQAEQKSLRYERKIDYLQGQIAQLQRMLFGQNRERFEGDPNQGVLPFEASEQQQREQQACHQETITYVRTKQPRQNHNGREPLPDHLPVEEIEIYPQGEDRKSTRLNSSHVAISYAVFCLKKKKRHQKRTQKHGQCHQH